jgi:arylsulfatase
VVDGVTQQPFDGASMRATFADASAPSPRSVQYFEMLGSRSIYHDGWKATTDHVSQIVPDERLIEGSREFETDRWNLFRLDTDFAEAVDLAGEHPDVVEELEALWWAEAERNHVLPIDDGISSRVAAMEPPLWPQPAHLRLRQGGGPVADEAVPSLAAGGLLTADTDVPASRAEGVLCAMGDWTNGWALLVLAGHPTFVINVAGSEYRITGPHALTPGRHRVGFRFAPDETGGGTGTLVVDDSHVAETPLPNGMGTIGMQIGGGGLRLGYDAGFPVSDDYSPPFRWTGILYGVSFDAAPPSTRQRQAEAAAHLRRE